MKSYNQIYGDLSVGAGSWMDNRLFEQNIKSPFSNLVIKSFKKQISKDLKRIKILHKIKKMSVMDVGSGRQAAAFMKLGARSVDHYDISAYNIRKIKKHLKNKKKFFSKLGDICKKNFNKNKKYDFIYLQGIIHHTKYPSKALQNISEACNQNGIVWLYHYQPTSLNYLYAITLRKIFKKKNLGYLNRKLIILNYNKKKINFLMDDLGCDYIHFLKPQYYKKIMESLGFKQFYKKDVEDLDKGIKFNNMGACLTAYKKIGKYKKKIFISEKKIDVFDLKNYKKKIKKQVAIIKTFDKKIFKILNNKKIKIDEKMNDLEPIIKGFTVFEKKTSLTDIISVYKKTYQNLLIRNKKIEI